MRGRGAAPYRSEHDRPRARSTLAGRPATSCPHAPSRSYHPYDGRSSATRRVPTDAQVEEAVAAAARRTGRVRRHPGPRRAPRPSTTSRAGSPSAPRRSPRLITAENGKPLKWARGEVGRAVVRRSGSPPRRPAASRRRAAAAGHRRGRRGPRSRSSGASRRGAGAGHRAVQLPAEPGAPTRSPRRSRSARRSSSSPRPATPLSALLLGELLAETDLPAGMLVGPAGRRTTACPPWSRTSGCRSISFTGSGPVGYAIMDVGAAQARAPSSSAATPRPSSAPTGRATPTWTGPRPASRPSPTTRAASPASPCSGSSSDARGLRPAAASGSSPPSRRRSPATPSRRRDRRRPAGQRGRRRARRGLGRRGRGGRRQGARPAASATAPPTRRPCSPTCPAGRQAATRGGLRPGADACSAFDGVDEAFAAVNDCRYGLQAGVFTHDLQTAFRAHRELEVGGVVIGDVPELPRRPDAVRRGQGVRRRPRGRARTRWTDYTYERVLVLTGARPLATPRQAGGEWRGWVSVTGRPIRACRPRRATS